MVVDAKRIWDRNSLFYDLFIAMDNRRRHAKVKKDMFSKVRGKVLEVGIGTGHNIEYYPCSCTGNYIKSTFRLFPQFDILL